MFSPETSLRRTWIATLFDDEHLDSTCVALAAVSDLEPEDDEGRVLDLRRQLEECDTKLARYRQLLDQDAKITVWQPGSQRSSGSASGSIVSSAANRPIYDELGVNLTYHPDGRVQVGAGGGVLRVRVGGGT